MCDRDNFFSIDNLVEFGMGMAVARQMVNAFNQGVALAMPEPDCSIRNAHVSMNGRDVGPLDEEDIRLLCCQKKICSKTLAWLPGMATWKPIEQIPEILKVIALTSLLSNKDEEY